MNAHHTLSPAPEFILVKGDARTMRSGQSIALSPQAPSAPTPAVKTARRMVAACRDNVRFFTHRFERYARWIDLPPVIDDVLYLGYSLGVRPSAPFSADALRRRLAAAGIETATRYSFVSPAPETDEAETICLPCHHTLSILDVQYIADTVDDFLVSYDLKRDAAEAEK